MVGFIIDNAREVLIKYKVKLQKKTNNVLLSLTVINANNF